MIIGFGGKPGSGSGLSSSGIDPDQSSRHDWRQRHRSIDHGHPGLVENDQAGGTDPRQVERPASCRGGGGCHDFQSLALGGCFATGKDHVQPDTAIRLGGRMPDDRLVATTPAHPIDQPGRGQLDIQLSGCTPTADADELAFELRRGGAHHQPPTHLTG